MATVRQKCLSASVYRPVMTRDRVNTFLGTHKSLAGMNRRLLPRVLQLIDPLRSDAQSAQAK